MRIFYRKRHSLYYVFPFLITYVIFMLSLIAQSVKNPSAMKETLVRFLGQEDLLAKGQATHSSILGLPSWLRWQRVHLQCRRPGFNPWVRKIPWGRERLPTPVFGLENSMGCIGYGVPKNQTLLSNFPFHAVTDQAEPQLIFLSMDLCSFCLSQILFREEVSFLANLSTINSPLIRKVLSVSRSVVSDSSQPHGLQPTRLLGPYVKTFLNSGQFIFLKITISSKEVQTFNFSECQSHECLEESILKTEDANCFSFLAECLRVNSHEKKLVLTWLLLESIWKKTQCGIKLESESEVAQSCPTLCDPVDCSLPGSSLHGILQARVLEQVAIQG